MIGDTDSGVPDPDTPPSELPDDALFAKLKDMTRKAWTSSSEWREKAEDWYAFEAGDQWSKADEERLRQQKRPCMKFNRVSSTVNAICGMEVNNRLETRFIPRTNDDTGVNDMLTECYRWVRDECNIEDEESTLFRDMNICGMGWAETHMDYEQDKDGLIIEERVDPLEMFWDPNAIKNNLGDARYLGRARVMSLETARAMFPDADDSDLNADWLKRTDREGDVTDREQARWYESGLESSKPTTCTIVCIEWYETTQVYVVLDPQTNQSQEFPTSVYNKMNANAKAAGITLQAAKRNKRTYYRAFLGAKILDEGEGQERLQSPCNENFTWKCGTAYRNRNKRFWYGVVEQMMDPQKWANAFLSSSLYSIMTSGKGIMAERDAFEAPQDAEDNWAQTDKITFMKTGALSGGNPKVLPKPMSQLHPQLQNLMTMSLDAIREVPGVNVEILGQANRDQPASLEYQRRQSVMAILAPLFDGLRRFRKEQGKLMLYFIKTYIPDGRMIRITGQEDAQYVPLVKLPDTIEYDVIVDEAATSPNQKEQTWSFLQTLLPMITQSVQMSLPMWGEILKASPLPAATVNNFLGVAEQQAQQPPPPNPDMIRANNDVQKTQIDAQKAQTDAQLKAQELALKQQELELSHLTLQHETARHALQLQADQQSQAQDAQSANEQAYAAQMGPALTDQVGGLAQAIEPLSEITQAIPQLVAQLAQQNAQTQQMIAALIQTSQQSAEAQLQATMQIGQALMAPKEIYNDPVTGMPKGVATVRSIQ